MIKSFVRTGYYHAFCDIMAYARDSISIAVHEAKVGESKSQPQFAYSDIHGYENKILIIAKVLSRFHHLRQQRNRLSNEKYARCVEGKKSRSLASTWCVWTTTSHQPFPRTIDDSKPYLARGTRQYNNEGPASCVS